MSKRERLSATVESEFLAAGRQAVAAGAAESLSSWVNEGLRLKIEHDRRIRAFDEFLASYEAEHGVITAEEMAAAEQYYRSTARVVRGSSAA